MRNFIVFFAKFKTLLNEVGTVQSGKSLRSLFMENVDSLS